VRITVALIAVAFITGCGSGVSSEQADSGYQLNEPAPLDRVSNRGTPFSSLLPRDEQALSRMEQGQSSQGIAVEDIAILGTRGDQSFYRLSDHCYGSGPASPTIHVFGLILCAPAFPSRAQPILDQTVYGSTAGPTVYGSTAGPTVYGSTAGPDERPQPRAMTVYTSQGIAADGVAKIALVDANGHVVAETSVLNNIYRLERIPAGNATKVVAYNATGEVVFPTPDAGSRATRR
jgi:hypothetical protein